MGPVADEAFSWISHTIFSSVPVSPVKVNPVLALAPTTVLRMYHCPSRRSALRTALGCTRLMSPTFCAQALTNSIARAAPSGRMGIRDMDSP